MSFQVGSSRFANDTLYKKMADIRMSPWRDGVDFDQEYKSNKESRRDSKLLTLNQKIIIMKLKSGRLRSGKM